MIFLYRAKLVILSQPKTGTTALDSALASRASLVVSGPPEMKHSGYQKFMRFVAPWIEAQAGLARQDYEVVSVMREPIDWLGSWYRYRTREKLSKQRDGKAGNYTGNVSFEQFAMDVVKPRGKQPSYARLGSPCGVALNGKGSVGVDRIFPYEDLSGLYELIAERTEKPVETALMNVSPPMDLTLSTDTRSKLAEKFAFAFELHASLRRDGTIDPKFRRPAPENGDDVE